MAISNRVGPPVIGEDFYGRKTELMRAHEYLDSYHSLVLSAPRRIGKSSFAKKLIEEKKAQGWTCVYIDLEGVQSRDEFLSILIKSFEKSGIWVRTTNAVEGIFNKLLEGVKSIGPLQIDFSKNETIRNLYSSLGEVIDHTKNTLVVVDELTLFLGSIYKQFPEKDEVGFLLNWFRSLRQVTDSKIRWVFCGSVGLHNFTNMHRLSMTINDLVPFDFDALSYNEAEGLIKALAKSEEIHISDNDVEYFLKKIAWHIPYFIQLIFTNIKKFPESKYNVNKMIIDKALAQLVDSEILNTWSERLSEYNDYEENARLLLNELSNSENGLTKSQLLALSSLLIQDNPIRINAFTSTTLNMLEHDGYIIRGEGGRRQFRSPLLKKWWQYHFVE